jgi:hypothetical protein
VLITVPLTGSHLTTKPKLRERERERKRERERDRPGRKENTEGQG